MKIKDFKPKKLSDFIFENDKDLEFLTLITKNSEKYLEDLKTGILLYGKNGVGKSELAKLLPQLIEESQDKKIDLENGVTDYQWVCPSKANTADGKKLLYPDSSSIFSGRQYVIIDECDEWRMPELKKLAGFMTRNPHVKYVFTTNNLEKIPNSILSRSHKFGFNEIDKNQWLKRFNEILSVAYPNEIVNDDELLTYFESSNGDIREAFSDLQARYDLKTAQI